MFIRSIIIGFWIFQNLYVANALGPRSLLLSSIMPPQAFCLFWKIVVCSYRAMLTWLGVSHVHYNFVILQSSSWWHPRNPDRKLLDLELMAESVLLINEQFALTC